METHSSILARKTHGERNLVGYSPLSLSYCEVIAAVSLVNILVSYCY